MQDDWDYSGLGDSAAGRLGGGDAMAAQDDSQWDFFGVQKIARRPWLSKEVFETDTQAAGRRYEAQRRTGIDDPGIATALDQYAYIPDASGLPALQQVIETPQALAMAHDDLPTLARIEKLGQTFYDQTLRFLELASYSGLEHGVAGTLKAVAGTETSFWAPVSVPWNAVAKQARQAGLDIPAFPTAAPYLNALADSVSKYAKRFEPTNVIERITTEVPTLAITVGAFKAAEAVTGWGLTELMALHGGITGVNEASRGQAPVYQPVIGAAEGAMFGSILTHLSAIPTWVRAKSLRDFELYLWGERSLKPLANVAIPEGGPAIPLQMASAATAFGLPAWFATGGNIEETAYQAALGASFHLMPTVRGLAQLAAESKLAKNAPSAAGDFIRDVMTRNGIETKGYVSAEAIEKAFPDEWTRELFLEDIGIKRQEYSDRRDVGAEISIDLPTLITKGQQYREFGALVENVYAYPYDTVSRAIKDKADAGLSEADAAAAKKSAEAAEAAPSAPFRAVDMTTPEIGKASNIPLDRIMVKIDAIGSKGEKVTVVETAKKALERIDEQADIIKRIMECMAK